MAELFIAADDFTGALDTGVKLAQQGIGVRVVSGVDNVDSCAETVLVANLDTRHVSRDEAYHRTLFACQDALRMGVRCIYIKTDSGLRGNIGAALEAAARAVNGTVVFVPAYPALNRRTEDGIVMIGDVPVTQSVFGRDPLNPVRHDSILDIIAEQTSLDVSLNNEGGADIPPYIAIEELNTDEEMLYYANVVGQIYEKKRDFADKHRVLGHILRRMNEKTRIKAYAGCAGFASVLNMLLGLKASKLRQAGIQLPLVVLSASLSQINFDQMRAGEQCGLMSYVFYDILMPEPDFEALVSCVLENQTSALIESAKTREDADELSHRGEEVGLDAAARANRIAVNMGRAAKQLVDAGFQGTLCLFGGDILSAALRSLQCEALTPLTEIEPGVVLSRAVLPGREITIVTKSGSFGSPDVIQKLMQYAEENQ
ncbi:MAG: four-carbon acid sugar kinase family protein [Clostridia bacterium]|nr:four-carbon acid sugar kinase family protein [Clostridia bacterium]